MLFISSKQLLKHSVFIAHFRQACGQNEEILLNIPFSNTNPKTWRSSNPCFFCEIHFKSHSFRTLQIMSRHFEFLSFHLPLLTMVTIPPQFPRFAVNCLSNRCNCWNHFIIYYLFLFVNFKNKAASDAICMLYACYMHAVFTREKFKNTSQNSSAK